MHRKCLWKLTVNLHYKDSDLLFQQGIFPFSFVFLKWSKTKLIFFIFFTNWSSIWIFNCSFKFLLILPTNCKTWERKLDIFFRRVSIIYCDRFSLDFHSWYAETCFICYSIIFFVHFRHFWWLIFDVKHKRTESPNTEWITR